jgi:thymidylate synthase (FAD)
MHADSEKLERIRVEELDHILGVRFPVLDDGFIRVVDYMGSDESIVQAARVSYGKGTKKVSEDKALIKYLLRNWHTTPFEMCELKLHVRVPMDCWRQWIRHRTASVNEYSTRYSEAIDASQRTNASDWREQSSANRQGSGGTLPTGIGEDLTRDEDELIKHSREVYERRLKAGVAREQARKDLPLSTYTEAYWKVDLHNLLNFLRLRMDLHAQLEIRSYAKVIGEEILSRWCPIAWGAFCDYRLKAMSLSESDTAIIQALSSGGKERAIAIATELGFLGEGGRIQKQNRERSELEIKLRQLGLAIPWGARAE